MHEADDHVFIPDGFEPPRSLVVTPRSGGSLRLEPLGPEHNERDHRAWTSSIEHIRSSPGFAGRRWPQMMSLADNARDVARHAEDFAARRGFTYTVLDEDDDVVGCVYIYPREGGTEDAQVRSWVRASRVELDGALRAAVASWLRTAWPFTTFRYEGV